MGPCARAAARIAAPGAAGAAFVTAGSAAIGARYAKEYGRPVLPIHNTFPLPAEAPDPGTLSDGALRLYWFSQTIGRGRGLEDVVRAIELSGIRAELHLRGAGAFECATPVNLTVRMHAPAPPARMIDLCRPYDIGLSPEEGRSLNRRALPEQQGADLYSRRARRGPQPDTAGHRALAGDLGEGALRYRPGDIASLAAGLRRWSEDRGALRRARAAAWQAAQRRWNWQDRRERGALLGAVEGALA